MKQFKKTFYFIFISAACYTYFTESHVNGATIGYETSVHENIQRKHVIRHVAEAIGMDSAEKMDDRRFRFYFFKLHDANGDNLLDGSELVKSVIHFYEELSAAEDFPSNSTEKIDVFSDETLARSVDSLLEAHDKNNDGLLDYLEFAINAPLVFR